MTKGIPLRLGVVGLGEGRSIMSAAIRSELWELGMICDLDEERMAARAKEFDFHRTTTDMADLLNDDSIDVIALYTPDPLHAPHVIACLRAGKHVICTKPLFDTLDHAREVYDLAKQSDKRVFVGQSSRFFEPMLHQRRDFEAGRNGELWCVEAQYNHDHRWYMKSTWAKGGGIKWVYCGLSHPVDLVRYYLPDIEEVFGYGVISTHGRELGITLPDCMQFTLKTKQGKIARVSGCYGMPHGNSTRDSMVSCILRGDRGTSQADYWDLRYATDFEGEGPKMHAFDDKAPYYFRFEHTYHHAGEFQNYIEHFARCLHAGVPAKPDLEEGIVTLAVLRAMEVSMAEGRPVKIQEILDRYNLSDVISFTA